MPRQKKTPDQPAAESDPMNELVQAMRDFKKEPTTWAENGLLEAVTPLIAGDAGELDSAKMLDTAFRVFKSTRSQVAAALLMEAAALYKSNYVQSIAAKFGVQISTADQLELPLDSDD